MKYLISTDGYKENSFNFIVENLEDIVKVAEFYGEEYDEVVIPGSFDINWNAKIIKFKTVYKWDTNDVTENTWYLARLYTPSEETKLYPK